MIGRTLGHYRVDKPLGAGGMGEVYSAHDTRLERDVALKVLPRSKSEDPSARKRFRQEALTLSRLNHPNIATIHDYDSADGVDFLVMELVRGSAPAGPLGEKQVVAIGTQIAEGLAAAHAHGVLHRDLKPANLAMTADGRIKILDFGLALLVRTTESSPTILHEQGTAGTLAYMAPEQINGTDIDERADIYATGAVLYELATGRRPFDSPVPGRLIHAILTEEPAAPSAINPAISPALDRIILNALDKDPKRRYQSADALLADLREPFGPSRLRMSAPRPAVFLPLKIAVRFENASGNPEDEVFANPIGSDLIFELMKSASVRVTNGASSWHVKREASIPDLARELHVDKVVEGSVQRNGTRVLLDVRLYDGESGQQLWSQVFDRAADDLSLVPSVALAIFDQLGVRLSDTERQRLMTAPQEARRVKAREACLQAVYAWQMRPPQLAKAKELLDKAIATDPTYARPYVLLAQYHAMLGMFTQTIPPMQFYPKAKELAFQGIRLDQNDNVALSAAHGVLAMTKLHHEWDWQGSEEEFKKATELNPSSASGHHWYSHLLLALDRVDESLIESEKAAEVDPLNVTWASCVGWHCLYARQYDRAVARSLEAVDMDPSAFSAYYYLGRAYHQKGRLPEAISSFEQAVELSNGAPPAMSGLSYACAAAGRKREAKEILAKLSKRSAERYIPAYDFAVVYAGLGDKENVFEWLEKAYLERSSWLVHVKWDERFERYRSDPRFAHLLRRIGLPV